MNQPTVKTALKTAFLPSLLAAAMTLSACSDSSPVTADDSASAATTEENEGVEKVNTNDSDTTAESISAEDQLLTKLSDYRWILDTATDSNHQPITSLIPIKEQVTLLINSRNNHTLSYSVGCNTMGASFDLEEDKLTISESMSTKMSCGELDKAETKLNQLMLGESQVNIAASSNNAATPTLTQVTSDDSTLVWSGRLTSQAKYNSKGETIFWEVAAESKPCQDNKTQMCLQVRPITYDEQGLKTSEGQYTEFAGSIDGYQHDGKHREILRLQRFKTTTDTVLADNVDSEFAYVLDRVIESTVVDSTE
ncbi:META domain-containing protein [Psychrobacter sp. 1U2]|uniref:META domain-containing protein n=1 Tax=Psychrobacter sp. 1U2 TaxID=3453577 RepID=UPI003F6DB45A